MSLQWGLAGGNAFGNALATGMAMGGDLRQRREEKEFKNALAGYDPDNADTLKPVMMTNPQVGMRLREEVRERSAQRQTADLTQRAVSGDPEALKQLATVNFDRWKALDGQQRDAAKQEAELFGNAAMDILNRPAEQRGAVVQAYAQRLGQQYPEIAQIASLPPAQLEAALRGAVAEAGMVKQLIELERPSYQAIPEGGTLVNTRDPSAVSQFGAGAGPANVPPPPAGFQIDGGQTGAPSATFSGSFRGLDGERVTSTKRSPARNRAVGGVSNSFHLTGQARDSVPPPGMSMSAYHARLKRLNPDKDVINEGDHVHMEPRG